MSIIRRKRRGNFAIVPNAIANDSRLSFEELGMLVYLLAKPDDWSVHVNELRRRGSVGRDKAYKMLRRLVELRYMHRTRSVDSKTGQFRGYEYEIRDEPNAAISPENIESSSSPDIQETGVSDVQPFPVLPCADNQHAIVKQIPTNTPQKGAPREENSLDDENALTFKDVFKKWPVAPTKPQGRPKRKWLRLSALERKRAAKGVENYLAHCIWRKSKVPSISSYLGDQDLWSFSPLPDRKPVDPIATESNKAVSKYKPKFLREWEAKHGATAKTTTIGAPPTASKGGFL